MTPLDPAVLSRDHVRALTMLARARNGVAETLLQARRIPTATLRDLACSSLVTIVAKSVRLHGRDVVVQRLFITDLGRQALGSHRPPRRARAPT